MAPTHSLTQRGSSIGTQFTRRRVVFVRLNHLTMRPIGIALLLLLRCSMFKPMMPQLLLLHCRRRRRREVLEKPTYNGAGGRRRAHHLPMASPPAAPRHDVGSACDTAKHVHYRRAAGGRGPRTGWRWRPRAAAEAPVCLSGLPVYLIEATAAPPNRTGQVNSSPPPSQPPPPPLSMPHAR